VHRIDKYHDDVYAYCSPYFSIRPVIDEVSYQWVFSPRVHCLGSDKTHCKPIDLPIPEQWVSDTPFAFIGVDWFILELEIMPYDIFNRSILTA
jgi:hypothetical protein